MRFNEYKNEVKSFVRERGKRLDARDKEDIIRVSTCVRMYVCASTGVPMDACSRASYNETEQQGENRRACARVKIKENVCV